MQKCSCFCPFSFCVDWRYQNQFFQKFPAQNEEVYPKSCYNKNCIKLIDLQYSQDQTAKIGLHQPNLAVECKPKLAYEQPKSAVYCKPNSAVISQNRLAQKM